ncbi:hypothetical protein [Actinomadura sp. 3N508]|uniref:hypothetical protein n=1 Tax=Actinomadura sp. 3N508 TaxID=3375153 RepID=UPI0037A4537E
MLIDERMGREDGSMQRRYTHVTQAMRGDLNDELTARWEASLAAGYAISANSPVAALDELLRARQRARKRGDRKIVPRNSRRDPFLSCVLGRKSGPGLCRDGGI